MVLRRLVFVTLHLSFILPTFALLMALTWPSEVSTHQRPTITWGGEHGRKKARADFKTVDVEKKLQVEGLSEPQDVIQGRLACGGATRTRRFGKAMPAPRRARKGRKEARKQCHDNERVWVGQRTRDTFPHESHDLPPSDMDGSRTDRLAGWGANWLQSTMWSCKLRRRETYNNSQEKLRGWHCHVRTIKHSKLRLCGGIHGWLDSPSIVVHDSLGTDI
ncbi:hypothetical protein B0J11DRAFT_535810 [Dendryphion nanum]|uniref:Uncharacterized protein n=1 Tax=Dendryphion nanum TaxID=256645 RepID=A0A9P9DED7_9PLEO|nr:hypothetical protein B0J11DRAFT_535810 [Dendryphion nanum]